MNSGLIAIGIGITAVFGALAMVLFRSPRRDGADAATPNVERVVTLPPDKSVPGATDAFGSTAIEPASVPPAASVMAESWSSGFESPISEPLISDRPISEISIAESPSAEPAAAIHRNDTPVADPWASSNEPVASDAALSLSEVTYDAIDLATPTDTATEIILDAPVGAATLMASGVIFPDQTIVADPAPFTRGSDAGEAGPTLPIAPIHDPQRPCTEALQNLSQDILTWGESKQLSHIPKLLSYANSGDSTIRAYVALALGKIAGPHTVKPEIQQVIPVLGKLTQDADAKVRLFAVQALGNIASPKVLPYLEQALLSPSGSVMKAAKAALQKLNLKPTGPAVAPANPPQSK
jgi:HEAT repeats